MTKRAIKTVSESRVQLESRAYNRPCPLTSLTTWTSDGFQNRTLQTEEIPQPPGIPDELCETRTWITQAITACGLVSDPRFHRLCTRWRTVRPSRCWHISQPLERTARPRIRLPARHQQPDSSRRSVHRPALRAGSRRIVHDVHEHTERLPAQQGIRVSRIRHAPKLRLHGHSILRTIPETHVVSPRTSDYFPVLQASLLKILVGRVPCLVDES